MSFSTHALMRLEEIESALYDVERQLLKANLDWATSKFKEGEVAVLVLSLERQLGDYYPYDVYHRDRNGNQVWAVIRQGTVSTLLLRRKNQPPERAPLDVDKVIIPKRKIFIPIPPEKRVEVKELCQTNTNNKS